MKIDPPLNADRSLVLLLNSVSGPLSFRFAVTTVAGANQNVPFPGTTVPAGTYLVRVQIDGAESALDVDADGHVTGPQVTV